MVRPTTCAHVLPPLILALALFAVMSGAFAADAEAHEAPQSFDVGQAADLESTADLIAGSASLGSRVQAAAEDASEQRQAVDPYEGTAYGVFNTSTGEYVLFRSNAYYDAGGGQTVTDIMGNTYYGYVVRNIEDVATINSYADVPCYFFRDKFKSVRVADGQRIRPLNCKMWFFGCTSLTSVDLSGLDMSRVTSTSYMFWGCTKLESIDVSGFDTSSVTDMSSMFGNCELVTELDVSGFDTSHVVNMSNMFTNCTALTNLDVSGFDTSSVTDLSAMFASCTSLTELDVSHFDTSSATTTSRMFASCKQIGFLDVSHFDMSSVTDMSGMFRFCTKITELDVSHFDTSSVRLFKEAFYSCSALERLDVSGFETAAATNFGYMFYQDPKLTSLDLSSFDTTSATIMQSMLGDGLRVVVLGERFSFYGNGGIVPTNCAILPTPISNDGTHNGKWASPSAGAMPQYTPGELRDFYNGATMAGTYVWAVSAHTISFDANGGSGLMQSAKVNVGDSYVMPDGAFERGGYEFSGWNTKADGTGTAFEPGESIAPTTDIVLYAQWSELRIVLEVPGEVLFELAPDGSLSCAGEHAVSIVNRSSVDVRLSGVQAEPAAGLAFVVNPANAGEMDARLVFDGGGAISLSDCASGGIELPSSEEWTIARGSAMCLTGADGAVGAIDLPTGCSSFPAGTIAWRFAV